MPMARPVSRTVSDPLKRGVRQNAALWIHVPGFPAPENQSANGIREARAWHGVPFALQSVRRGFVRGEQNIERRPVNNLRVELARRSVRKNDPVPGFLLERLRDPLHGHRKIRSNGRKHLRRTCSVCRHKTRCQGQAQQGQFHKLTQTAPPIPPQAVVRTAAPFRAPARNASRASFAFSSGNAVVVVVTPAARAACRNSSPCEKQYLASATVYSAYPP